MDDGRRPKSVEVGLHLLEPIRFLSMADRSTCEQTNSLVDEIAGNAAAFSHELVQITRVFLGRNARDTSYQLRCGAERPGPKTPVKFC